VALGEIEHALRTMPEVADTAVVPWDDPRGDTRLAAYVVAAHPPLALDDVRRFLRARLPAFMVPATLIALDALPRTPNGKVDRLHLPPPTPSRPALATPLTPPRTPIEERLVVIWCDVLGVEPVGVDDPFLDLGGDSVRAMRIASRVQESW